MADVSHRSTTETSHEINTIAEILFKCIKRLDRVNAYFFYSNTTASHEPKKKQELLNFPVHKPVINMVTQLNSIQATVELFLERPCHLKHGRILSYLYRGWHNSHRRSGESSEATEHCLIGNAWREVHNYFPHCSFTYTAAGGDKQCYSPLHTTIYIQTVVAFSYNRQKRSTMSVFHNIYRIHFSGKLSF